MRKFRWGASLVTVLLAMSLVLLLLLTMAQASVYHLNFSSQVEGQQLARNMAEAVVAEVLAEAMADDNYGKSDLPPTLVQGPQGSYGVLCFGNDARVPRSRNNLNSLNQLSGSTGLAIPGNAVHLVGRGYFGSQSKTVEMLFYRPPFPKAMAATGPILATGTQVRGLQTGSAFPPAPGDILPGSLQSNSASTSPPAIRLQHCDVSGDAAACGNVVLDPLTLVRGEVRQGGTPQAIPHVDVSQRIRDIENAQGTILVSGSLGSQTVDWYTGCPSGPLSITGDLTLNNGVLWTKGDLTVRGGVKGQGLILCGGQFRLEGGSQLSAQNLIALASVGNVSFQGSGRSSYFFQGLVYTNGSFVARDLTVRGAVIAESSDPNLGGMQLQDVDFDQDPAATYLSMGQMMVVRNIDGGLAPPAPARGNLPKPVTLGPYADQSPVRMIATPTWGSVANMTHSPGSVPSLDTRFNFTMFNVNNGALRNLIDIPRHGDHNPVNIQKSVRIWEQSPKWIGYLGLIRGVTHGNINDAIHQTDSQLSLSLTEQISSGSMILPPINSLMPPGERSKVLYWTCY